MCRIILKQSQDLFQLPDKVKDLSMTMTFTERSVKGSIKSSSSHRSKYLSNARLTKNSLFFSFKSEEKSKNSRDS